MPLMKAINDPFFLFYAWILGVWLLRAKRALQTIQLAPAIHKSEATPSPKSPFVTIFVPAKNEENNILKCVQSLQAQNYPAYEIIVINDNSVDKTEDILKDLGAVELTSVAPTKDLKLKYINAEPVREGWTGKNSALDQAIAYASGDWFLFTDADTYHEPECLSSCVDHIQRNSLSLLTLSPRCLTGGFWEDMIQPSAMCFTGLWFPVEKVNNPQTDDYFGNGQFLMMSRKAYKKIGGHDAVKGAFLEDFALVKKAKEAGFKIQVALGTAVYGTRMYDSLATMWRGWRRIFLHAFERQWTSLLTKAGGVLVYSVLPFVLFFPVLSRALAYPEKYGFTLGFAIPILTFILATAWKAYRIVRGKTIYTIFHPLASLYLVGVLIDAMTMAYTGKKTVWR